MDQIELASIEQCTGCMACMVACKKKAISFTEEKVTLHTYPVIDHTVCIGCKKCVKSCPILNFETIKDCNSYNRPITYCGWHIDESVRSRSTSGGVGTALAEIAIKSGYKVVGAKFDNQWHLLHDIASKESDLIPFAGSKYLLSDIEKSLNESLLLLNKGVKIFFIGTPCQCEAIKTLVPHKQKRDLLTCSIICHGVNSPIVWQDFVGFLEKKNRSHLESYNFRSKKLGWGKLFIDYRFASGKRVEQKARYNLFHFWFGQHYIQRLSCFNCKFRTKRRYTDFIIGDFWGIEKIFPDLDIQKGVSALIANSEESKNFLKTCTNLKLIETNVEHTYSVLKGFTESQNEEVNEMEIKANMQFTKDYKQHSFESMSKLYPVPSLTKILFDYISSKLKD